MNRRRWTSFQKNIKDYIVPIVWVFLILILIISFFRWWEDPKVDVENKNWLNIELENDFSDVVIEYSWWNREDYEWESDLYKWEKLIVRDWNVSLSSPELWADFTVNKLWEIKYLESGWFEHTSWDVWINTTSPIDVDMNFAKLKIGEDSHLSLSQNEVSSTIYLVSWFLEVSNLVWRNTVLSSWEKISISRTDASNEDVDLSLLKENIDEFFIRSDWFILNNWSSYVDNEWEYDESSWSGENVSSGSWTSTNFIWGWNRYLSFDNLIDESNVSSPSIDISWTYNSDIVYDFTVNWKTADLNSENSTFEITWINTSNSVNDLVFKVYNDSNSIVSKFVYTVYYSDWASWWNNSEWWFSVKTYDVDWSDFKFTSPTTSNSYTTTETFVTIRWEVTNENIDRVTVNGYELSSFNWTTWRYHADVNYNNLAEWTNVYEVKYFSWDDLVYTNYYTIIKRSNSNNSWVISWESNI